MGCNFYLRYKNKMDVSVHNSFTDFSEHITELDNGWVYKNHYYEKLPEEFIHLLHIGKSSMGWHFSLCIYPEFGINDLDDWERLFDKYEIEDEYGDIISKDIMMDRITRRRGENTQMSNEELEKFCRDNHCELGIEGLFAHKSTSYGEYTRTTGTYDLTRDWDFC